MDTDNTPRPDEGEGEGADAGEEPVWKVEGEETMDKLQNQIPPSSPRYDGGGMMIFTDEQGRRRRIPAERGQMGSVEMRAAAHALHRDLGAPAADYRMAAVMERLNELRASGRMSEEDYQREKRRLENYNR